MEILRLVAHVYFDTQINKVNTFIFELITSKQKRRRACSHAMGAFAVFVLLFAPASAVFQLVMPPESVDASEPADIRDIPANTSVDGLLIQVMPEHGLSHAVPLSFSQSGGASTSGLSDEPLHNITARSDEHEENPCLSDDHQADIYLDAPTSAEYPGPVADEPPSTESTGNYIWPADGKLASLFGPRDIGVGSTYHKGIDIGGSLRQPIFAADGGEVIVSEYSESYGYYIRIRHDNGDETLYAHCVSLSVRVGDLVWQGQEIALMGSTGISTGVHLHFELIINGRQVDPLRYLP
jgi:hypothetical protein